MRTAILALFSLLIPVVAHAQQPISGMPPFGSFQTSGFDTVDRYNMNANFAIPIVSSAGRGVPFNFSVVYDSSVWTHYSVSYWTANIGGGWKTDIPAGVLTYSTSTGRCDTPPPYHSYTRYFNFRYTDAAGTTHPIALSYYGPNVCGLTPVPPRSAYASDASGYYAYASTAQNITITAKSGTVTGTPQIIDSNGNVVSSTVNGSETDWTDSAGHLELKVITSSTQIQYEYPDTSGTYQIATLKLQPYNVKTNFACSGITEYSGTQTLPYELDLADPSQKYTFTYENTPGNSGYITGRVQRVTLPTGGYYEYDYGTTNDGIYCSDGSTVSMSRVVNDGTNSNTWQYTRALIGGNQVTTVTDPASNAANYTFNASAQETSEKHYQGSTSGSLQRTVNTTWASNGTPATAITILEDNSTQSEVETSYDNYGNLLTLKEHDWGAGAPSATILRTTTNTYLSTSSYITANILNRPTLTTIADQNGMVNSRTVTTYDDSGYINTPCISGAAQHDDAGHGCSYTVRGNPTSITRYTNANAQTGPITKHNTYDSLGNLVGADVDCCRHEQLNFSATTQYAYPDSTVIGTAPNQFTTTYTYSAHNGLMASSSDPNNQPTSYAYDSMLRPTVLATCCSYAAINYQSPNTVQIVQNVNNSGTQRDSYVAVDGLGRKNRVAIPNGEANPFDETLNTCFNSIGLVSFQAYPFQDAGWGSGISCSIAGDSYTYDALGRPVKITHADGSYGAISYTTNCATATDEQGKARKVCTDGLGRVTSVIEDPGTSPHLNYTTTYAYDALDNVASVVQGSETRSFAYDGLSRLASATNPESGTISYTYDAYSNVATRTDARSIITTYSYDAAERLTSKTYSDGTPGAYFYYDQSSWNGITLSNGIGRLTSQGVYNGSQWLASSAFSYDGLGHVTNNPQYTLTINSILQVPYTYDLVGDMLTYGNGASWLTFSQSFNIGGRVTGLTSSWVDSQHPGTLVSGAHYNGAGGVTSYVLGNNLTETVAYNGLVQPCRMNVNSSGALLGSCTASVPSGNVLDLTTGFNYGSGDNGNVMSWAAAGQQTFNRSYTYDGVNRLASMSAPGSTCTGLTWSYDQWANRTDQSYTGGTCNTFHQPVNGNNHFINSPYQYDAAGNMTHDATHSYAYDAENRITKVDGGSTATYGYDADGRRASRVVAGVETDYIYDLSGHVVADYGGGCGPTCWRVGYVYLNGEAVAEYFGGTNFYVTDHLGSTRLLTGYPTASVVECDDYYPFGEQVSCGGTSTTTHKFTGYERDAESNLDNAQARYNSSSLGRFMSPDPLGNFVADSTNPQTWNMYAYVNNNPLTYVDPSGTICTQDSQGNFVGDTCGQDTGTGNAPETVNVTTNDSNGNQNTQAWSSADPTFLNFGDGDITALRQSRPDAGWINLQMRRLQAMAGFFRAPSNEAMKFATRNVPGGGQPFKTTPPPSQIPGEEPPPSIEDIIGERGMQMKELMDKIGEWSAGTMEGIGDGLGDFMLQITHAQPCLNPNGCIPSS